MSSCRYAVVMLLVGGLASAQAPIRSGPQPKEDIPGAFRPLNINGKYANEPHCLVCENGLHPVVMIFAHDLSDPLVNLIAKVETEAVKHRKQSLGAFVVFLKDGEAFRKDLEQVAKTRQLRHTILSIEDPAVLSDFKLAKNADVTVVLYTESVVRVNYAFQRGMLNDRAIEKILGDIPKILPTK